MSRFDPTKMVPEAMERIEPYVRRTILEPSAYYSQRTGADVYFKCENLQHTGSFKARGALSKILSLSPQERAKGIVTASTGNHGAACAFAMQQVGAGGIVFVPETAWRPNWRPFAGWGPRSAPLARTVSRRKPTPAPLPRPTAKPTCRPTTILL